MAAPVRQWRFDLSSTVGERPPTLPRPPGWFHTGMLVAGDNDASGPSALAQAALKKKRAMEIAMSPAKTVLMNAFMMYMSGASIHIFSIMITFMAIMNPAKNILNMHTAFRSLDDGKTDLLLPKLLYGALNVAGVCVALYKMAKMGLLPVTAADWMHYLVSRETIEYSGVPLGI